MADRHRCMIHIITFCLALLITYRQGKIRIITVPAIRRIPQMFLPGVFPKMLSYCRLQQFRDSLRAFAFAFALAPFRE